jgi:hypothetical protein
VSVEDEEEDDAEAEEEVEEEEEVEKRGAKERLVLTMWLAGMFWYLKLEVTISILTVSRCLTKALPSRGQSCCLSERNCKRPLRVEKTRERLMS